MEYHKIINLLDNTQNEPSIFVLRRVVLLLLFSLMKRPLINMTLLELCLHEL